MHLVTDSSLLHLSILSPPDPSLSHSLPPALTSSYPSFLLSLGPPHPYLQSFSFTTRSLTALHVVIQVLKFQLCMLNQLEANQPKQKNWRWWLGVLSVVRAVGICNKLRISRTFWSDDFSQLVQSSSDRIVLDIDLLQIPAAAITLSDSLLPVPSTQHLSSTVSILRVYVDGLLCRCQR